MERAAPQATFATLLRRYRQAAGLTQEELAERAHLSVRGITDLERGARRTPRRDTIALLAAALALAPAARADFEAAARSRLFSPSTAPVQQDRTLSGSGALPPLQGRRPRATNLPPTLTSLIGRE
ncbi:MAG TPA: helix-turn-helix transcriptional regulator, partial [Chloroflexota bacterium]|nr:helix-turn-helix transcriptional regulator [Chloroflexota bacterium]